MAASHTSATLLGLSQPLVQTGCRPLVVKLSGVGTLLRDMHYGGAGVITGTVKEAGTPDTPVKRRVRLYRKIDGAMVRDAWSAADGTYTFSGIAIEQHYVTSFDHTGNYNAVIKDSIKPDAMS